MLTPQSAPPRAATPDHHPDGESSLLHRIAIALVLPALLGGLLVTDAMGTTTMPTTMPVPAVAAAPQGGPTGPAPGTASRGPLPGRVTLASAYHAYNQGNFCPGFPQTTKTDLTVGTNLVPCGTFVRVCLTSGKKCVVVQRRDSGPVKAERGLDLNLGAVRALGMTSIYHWGVRTVRWGPVSGPARSVASIRTR